MEEVFKILILNFRSNSSDKYKTGICIGI